MQLVSEDWSSNGVEAAVHKAERPQIVSVKKLGDGKKSLSCETQNACVVRNIGDFLCERSQVLARCRNGAVFGGGTGFCRTRRIRKVQEIDQRKASSFITCRHGRILNSTAGCGRRRLGLRGRVWCKVQSWDWLTNIYRESRLAQNDLSAVAGRKAGREAGTLAGKLERWHGSRKAGGEAGRLAGKQAKKNFLCPVGIPILRDSPGLSKVRFVCGVGEETWESTSCAQMAKDVGH